jgi:hypothetical protein
MLLLAPPAMAARVYTSPLDGSKEPGRRFGTSRWKRHPGCFRATSAASSRGRRETRRSNGARAIGWLDNRLESATMSRPEGARPGRSIESGGKASRHGRHASVCADDGDTRSTGDGWPPARLAEGFRLRVPAGTTYQPGFVKATREDIGGPCAGHAHAHQGPGLARVRAWFLPKGTVL